ncbi:unnamed protein product [Mucor hiemalis]
MANTLESSRKAWDVIFSDPNLSLNSLRHRAVAGTVCQTGLRSVCWKVFLGYLPTLEVSTWPSIQQKERQRYTDLKRQYIEEPAEKMNKKGEEDLSDNNPLALNDSNPWQQFFADSEIRKVIRQDVERTFPDVDFFREDEVQQRLTDILFIYCKLNLDVSYRQGMHELLAPIYWVLALESLDLGNIDIDYTDPDSKLLTQVLDSAFVEHDAYTLFDRLMTYGKSWYEFNDDVPSRQKQSNSKSDIMSSNVPKPTDSARLNPVVMICHRIHHQYLRTVDPILYKHLENFGIEPQLYGIRWIRLLFGREFEIHELLKLWDAIFAEDPSLQIVDYICLAILLKMRDQLLQKDYAECLTFLMRPPQINKPATLVEQAKYLQDNLTQDAALHILQQNDIKSGKEPRTSLSDGVAEMPAPVNYPRQQQMHRTLQHRSSQGSNMDTSFARITSGMMKNPQMRDFNKAIAGVMGSVQKNVNNFGENVLGRSDGLGPRRSTVSSEFPSGIDRVATSFKQERVTPLPKSSDDRSSSKSRLVNQQMGELMAKCISMLEDEIFSPTSEAATNEATMTDKADTTEENVVPDVDTITPTEEEERVLEDNNAEDNKKNVTVTIDKDTQEAHKIPARNEATIIMALAGLKHVRDVLLDASDEWKWDMVDHKDAIINSPVPSAMDDSQSAKRSIFIPQTSASIISKDTDINYVKDKPLPLIVEQKTSPPPVVSQPKLPQVPITYIPANPTPPKQPIKYSIEDLLSDPDLQLASPKASANVKFKWMLSNENEEQSGANVVSNDLFKTEQAPKMAPRKRSSFIINKSVPVGADESIDPLDAKNVDNRRAYEYDMF